MKGTYRVVAPLLGLFDSPDCWREEALCAEVDRDLFFPEDGVNATEAKQVCGLCPVKRECLEDALVNNDRFGVRGGLTPCERRKLRRKVQELPRLEPKPVDPWPARNAEILHLADSGLSDVQIAQRVGVSTHAVERALARSTTSQSVTQAA